MSDHLTQEQFEKQFIEEVRRAYEQDPRLLLEIHRRITAIRIRALEEAGKQREAVVEARLLCEGVID